MLNGSTSQIQGGNKPGGSLSNHQDGFQRLRWLRKMCCLQWCHGPSHGLQNIKSNGFEIGIHAVSCFIIKFYIYGVYVFFCNFPEPKVLDPEVGL